MAEQPCVTILIPHYKTLKLTKLCLRSINKYTDTNKIKVVVIDNDSNDDSTAYLKSLEWITLIERPAISGESPSAAHASAMDIGMQSVDTKYVLSFHTDTIVCQNGWLEFLISKMEQDDNIAGVGSWKLEHKSAFRLFAKKSERILQFIVPYFFLGRRGRKRWRNNEGRENYYYLRSHCALYQTDLLRRHECKFNDGNETAGKAMHKKLIAQGCEMLFLESSELIHYVKHLNHATMILNPDIAGVKSGSQKERNRILKELKNLDFNAIIENTKLDHV